MKNLANFYMTVEISVDPRLVLQFKRLHKQLS